MAGIVNIGNMSEEMQTLKKEVQFLKNCMIDMDLIMTPDEEKSYEKAMRELKEGKAISLEDLEKELDI